MTDEQILARAEEIRAAKANRGPPDHPAFGKIMAHIYKDNVSFSRVHLVDSLGCMYSKEGVFVGMLWDSRKTAPVSDFHLCGPLMDHPFILAIMEDKP